MTDSTACLPVSVPCGSRAEVAAGLRTAFRGQTQQPMRLPTNTGPVCGAQAPGRSWRLYSVLGKRSATFRCLPKIALFISLGLPVTPGMRHCIGRTVTLHSHSL